MIRCEFRGGPFDGRQIEFPGQPPSTLNIPLGTLARMEDKPPPEVKGDVVPCHVYLLCDRGHYHHSEAP